MQVQEFCAQAINDEQLVYITSCLKYDRHGYKTRMRTLLLTDRAIYLIDEKSLKLKHRLELKMISLVVTKYCDNFVIIRIPLDLVTDKGDLLLLVNNAIELTTQIVETCQNPNIIEIASAERYFPSLFRNYNRAIYLYKMIYRLEHFMVKGKAGFIDLKSLDNCEPGLVINKHGHLIIVS